MEYTSYGTPAGYAGSNEKTAKTRGDRLNEKRRQTAKAAFAKATPSSAALLGYNEKKSKQKCIYETSSLHFGIFETQNRGAVHRHVHVHGLCPALIQRFVGASHELRGKRQLRALCTQTISIVHETQPTFYSSAYAYLPNSASVNNSDKEMELVD